MPGRGGKRPGAGRKRDPNPMVTAAFVIRQDHAAWLADQEENTGSSKSETVRAALDAAMKAEARRAARAV